MPPLVRLRVAAGLVFFAALAGSADSWSFADDAATADDGWRRTVDGWERIEDLHIIRREATAEPKASASRWDFHPAALALLQVVATAAAYATAKPGRRSGDQSAVSELGQALRAA